MYLLFYEQDIDWVGEEAESTVPITGAVRIISGPDHLSGELYTSSTQPVTLTAGQFVILLTASILGWSAMVYW